MIAFSHIWEARNDVRNGEKKMHSHCIAEKIFVYVNMALLHMYGAAFPKRCDPTKTKKRGSTTEKMGVCQRGYNHISERQSNGMVL
jgi:hypothetical protein